MKKDISIWDLSSNTSYLSWRKQKLAQAKALFNAPFVKINDLSKLSDEEKTELISRCAKTNMALYQTKPSNNPDEIRLALRAFSTKLGLEIAEKHRSAGKSGIVAITQTDAPTQRAYIPYSNKALNWHTDGYYNAPDKQIRAMVLHCVYPANSGGQSQFIDNEIVYIRLRDHNPDFIKALMHPKAMSIPQNIDEKGNIRPTSIGPVFSIDPINNNLLMRYTARTRSIEWRKDETTQAAVAFLHNLLINGDEFLQTGTLKAGQGILCNNSLHNRTGFDPQINNQRMLFRIRFFNRIKGS